MPRYVDAIDLPIPIEAAFDYLADFSRTAEWDPGVEAARRLTKGRVRRGSRFEVVVAFFGQRLPLEYEITEFDRPSRLVLRGGDSSMDSIDEITFVERPGGTRVTYEARIELLGIRRIAEPIVDLLMQRVGRLAVRGLRERLSDTGSEKREAESKKHAAGAPAERARSSRQGKKRTAPRKTRRTRTRQESTTSPTPEGAVQ